MKKPTPLMTPPAVDELFNDDGWNGIANHIGDCFYKGCPASDADLVAFKATVKKVLAYVEGENDGPSEILVAQHKDGTVTVSQSSADYTGHG